MSDPLTTDQHRTPQGASGASDLTEVIPVAQPTRGKRARVSMPAANPADRASGVPSPVVAGAAAPTTPGGAAPAVPAATAAAAPSVTKYAPPAAPSFAAPSFAAPSFAPPSFAAPSAGAAALPPVAPGTMPPVAPPAAPSAGWAPAGGFTSPAAPGPVAGAPAAGGPNAGAPTIGGSSLATLDARNISAWFGDHQVLDRVSLTMPAGVITSLIGPSGCGKSTFLRILNRMHELVPSASLAGEVLLDGDDVYDTGRRLTDARKSIGMVFQKPNPFPAMSIYDNVLAGLKLTGTRATRDDKDYLVESSLSKAGLWKEVKDRLRAPGGGLSGGQQQRLCIARSLAVKPRVLLMDEPCSALDPTSTRVIEETMLELIDEVTIVIVTHNMQQAQRVSQQCAFFLAAQGTPGAIVEYGDTEAMFSSPIDSRTFDYVNGRFG
ncbi:phosphate ABC transporter ATP-binding protein [Glaciihabitans tibetensis]|uniref:Phosphate ABC transporter ATP-binding protein n=1 Tax=Glaciihabitans tibetensis TaxID=1266600 RepID=A0A2T0VBQ3_9MICO|nr:phosphate ABC transporter ATP-binding protein [Glaciihabitans tibetensis]